MAITIDGNEFEVFHSTSDLKNMIGVYIIYRKNTDDTYGRVYIGYSDKVRDRVEGAHHKKDCWNRNTNNDPYYAVHYTGSESKGRMIETELINTSNTPCNDT